MEIKARCKCDVDSLKALTRLSMFKKGNPKKRMILLNIFFSVLFVIIIFEIIMFGINFSLVMAAIATPGVLFWNAYLWFLYPKVNHKSMGKMKDAENEYIFCDDKIKISSKAEEYNCEGEVEYTLFAKAFETSEYFFLYQTKNQVLIVDKSTIEGGSAEDIRNKLSEALKNKYIICKY